MKIEGRWLPKKTLTVQYRRSVGYNDLDFFEKIKSPNPEMDEEMNSKTHL